MIERRLRKNLTMPVSSPTNMRLKGIREEPLTCAGQVITEKISRHNLTHPERLRIIQGDV